MYVCMTGATYSPITVAIAVACDPLTSGYQVLESEIVAQSAVLTHVQIVLHLRALAEPQLCLVVSVN
jgi:hypothetical protein